MIVLNILRTGLNTLFTPLFITFIPDLLSLSKNPSRPLLFSWCRLQQVALVVLDAPAVTLKRRKTLKEEELRSRVARAWNPHRPHSLCWHLRFSTRPLPIRVVWRVVSYIRFHARSLKDMQSTLSHSCKGVRARVMAHLRVRPCGKGARTAPPTWNPTLEWDLCSNRRGPWVPNLPRLPARGGCPHQSNHVAWVRHEGGIAFHLPCCWRNESLAR